MKHLTKHEILDKFQSAYRPGFSTESALLRVLNDILCSVDTGKVSLLVLLDLSAAFDTINHQLLLERLHLQVGITGTAHRWFVSYLEDRSQTVCVGASFSEPKNLSCGVPQGSVLGPVLFSLYMSQLGAIIDDYQINRQSFADDSQLYDHFTPDPTVARAAIARLEECCDAVKTWMTKNMLKLNDEKTNYSSWS